MKKILSFLLCLIIPFIFLCPLSSSAFDVQGTEYSEPGLLPPDINFSEYDYYFLTVSGTPENPVYFMYLVKDNSDTGRMYFTIAKSTSSTRYHTGEFTSFGITTNYDVTVLVNNKVTGLWASRSGASSSDYSGFAFDDYSSFTSSSRYIIGSNCNVYSYSGSLLRSGDYDNLNLFFLGGLQGSSDRTEKPTEPTEPIVTTPSGGGSADLSGISDLLVTLIDAVKSDKVVVHFDEKFDESFSSILTKLDSILTQVVNILTANDSAFTDFKREFDEIEAYLSDIYKAFLEFTAVGDDIKNLPSLFSEVNLLISNVCRILDDMIYSVSNIKDNIALIKLGIDNFNKKIPSDFDSIIKSIKDNISLIKLGIDNLNKKIPSDFANIMGVIKDSVTTVKIKIDSVVDSVSDLSGKLSDIYSELNDISYYSKWINNNIRDYLGKIFDSVDSISAILDAYCVNVSSNIFSILGSVDKIKDLLSIYCKGMAECVVSIKNSVLSLPENLKSLLKELFIPKEDHFSSLLDEINEHFAFAYQIAEIGDAIFHVENFEDTIPVIELEFDSDLFGHFDGKLIDFSVIPYDYIIWFKLLVSGIVTYSFIVKIRKRLPSIINGGSS